MNKNILKSITLVLVSILVFTGLIFALNLLTGPIIEKNNSGKELAGLKVVLPEGNNFEAIYDAANPGASELKDVPATVTNIYKETDGKGYVFKCSTTSNYSKSPLTFTMGVTSEGIITGVTIDTYAETQDFKDYPNRFIGQNSTLADVGVYANVTYSSVAFKNAVLDGFNALIVNNLMKEAEKSPEQILKEFIWQKHSGLASGEVLKTTDATATGNIVSAMKGENGSGFALVMKEGDNFFLAVTNNMNGCLVYDVEGKDVTSEHEALKTEALTYQKANQTNYQAALEKKITNVLMKGAEGFTALDVNSFNTVVAAVTFTFEGANYYGFYARSFGFQQMDVFYVLDENGAIVNMTAETFIFDEEYFMAFDKDNWNVTEYRNGFVGLTGETFDGSQALIATATLSSNAMKTATNDIFACFKAVKGGN